MLRLIFAVSVSIFFFLLIWGRIRKRLLPSMEVKARMRGLSQPSVKGEAGTDNVYPRPADNRRLSEIPFSQRVLLPLLRSLEHSVRLLAPAEISAMLDRKLIIAGLQYKITPGRIIIIMAALGIFAGGLSIYRLRFADYLLIQKFIIILLAISVSAYLPIALLNIRIGKRKKAIFHQLPEVLDLLSVSVEAGLSFDAALRRIVDRMTGPLIDECRKFMGDVSMGMTRRAAMQRMAERCDVDEVSLFVTSIIQAERLGTSIGATLQIQAENVREVHRNYVKALALKAPIKIVFPLVFFIFPALLIVAVGPPLITIAEKLLGNK